MKYLQASEKHFAISSNIQGGKEKKALNSRG